MHDIVIVGGGPAGMTAAIYARRAGKTVLVLEALACGGQILNTPDIENYPGEAHISGFDFATKLQEQAAGLGAEFAYEKATGIRREDGTFAVVTAANTHMAKAVILATGSENRKLGVEGEAGLVGKGISYCATCDGNFYRKKVVAVVGGGNTALEDALYLSDIARQVYLIHRRDSFRGDAATVAQLTARKNVTFLYNSVVTALHADKRLHSIDLTDKAGAVTTVETDGLFVAVGRIPSNGDFAGLIELDETGYVAAGENCRTNVPGIFAAGDNRVKDVRQLVTAAADGAVAATEAIRYIGTL